MIFIEDDMEYIIISFLLIIIIGLSYSVWQMLGTIQEYEENNQQIFIEMSQMAEAINQVLSKEIYSNDPVIMSFVENLRDIEYFIRQIDPNLEFNQLGEKTDG